MLNYKELMEVDKAFERFLHSYRGRPLIRIEYLQSKSKIFEYSFVGHKTEGNGRFGLYYNKQRFSFEFGTRGGNCNSWIHGLTYPQQNKIPGFLKEALKEVVVIKKVKHVHVPRKSKNGFNEWE